MHKKILIVGNGPSLTKIDYRRIPKDTKVLRLNNFFFEDKYYVGKKVDFYFANHAFFENQFYNLYNLEKRGEYAIDTLYCCDVPKEMSSFCRVVNDADPIVYQNKDIAKFLIYHAKYYNHLVSGGIYTIFLMASLGYTEIYMVGFDFYSSENYPWKHNLCPNFLRYTPRDKDENVKNVIQQYHPQYLQIEAMKLAQQIFNIKLYSVSANTALNEFIPLAPILDSNFASTLIEDKPANYTSDWLLLPRDIVEQEKETISDIVEQENDTKETSKVSEVVKQENTIRKSPTFLQYVNFQRIRICSHIFGGKKGRHYQNKKQHFKKNFRL